MMPIMLATAVSAADYRSLDPAPVAVEGGVLVFPIGVEGDAPPDPESWPSEIPVVLDDGRELPARIDWLVRSPEVRSGSWTVSGEPFTIVDRTREPDALPMLQVQLPRGYRGDVGLSGGTVSPRWLRPPSPVRRSVQAAAVDSADALPDPEHPLEWFRWVLLAERIGDRPPPPPGDAGGQLAARHLAEVWRSAIARIERASPGVAEELRQRLTATCTLVDGSGTPREVAAWVADPQDLRTLLSIAIDAERDDAAAMQGVLSWLRREPQVMLWPEEVRGEEVVFTAANPEPSEVVLRCRWLEGDPVPLAVVVPPRTVQRVVLQRPVREGVSSDGGVLFVEHGVHRRRLEFGERPAAIRPPGTSVGRFQRPLSLADVQSGRSASPPPSRGGAAELRRRQGRWELFIECFRPEGARRDEVAIRLGEASRPVARLTIPETGAVASGEAEVHRASHADRWRCRVVLPEAWLAEALVGTRAPGVGLSIERRLDLGGGTVERTAIGPAIPAWCEHPPTEVHDLSRWPRGPAESTTLGGEETTAGRRILAP